MCVGSQLCHYNIAGSLLGGGNDVPEPLSIAYLSLSGRGTKESPRGIGAVLNAAVNLLTHVNGHPWRPSNMVPSGTTEEVEGHLTAFVCASVTAVGQ